MKEKKLSAIFYQTFRNPEKKRSPNAFTLQLSPTIISALEQKPPIYLLPTISVQDRTLTLKVLPEKLPNTRKVSFANNGWAWVSLSKFFTLSQRISLHKQKANIQIIKGDDSIVLKISNVEGKSCAA